MVPLLLNQLSNKISKTKFYDAHESKYTIFHTPATQLTKFEGIGGQLILEKEILLFIPHLLIIQKQKQVFSNREIKAIETPANKELVIFFEKEKEVFIVDHPIKWKEKLNIMTL